MSEYRLKLRMLARFRDADTQECATKLLRVIEILHADLREYDHIPQVLGYLNHLLTRLEAEEIA